MKKKEILRGIATEKFKQLTLNLFQNMFILTCGALGIVSVRALLPSVLLTAGHTDCFVRSSGECDFGESIVTLEASSSWTTVTAVTGTFC